MSKAAANSLGSWHHLSWTLAMFVAYRFDLHTGHTVQHFPSAEDRRLSWPQRTVSIWNVQRRSCRHALCAAQPSPVVMQSADSLRPRRWPRRRRRRQRRLGEVLRRQRHAITSRGRWTLSWCGHARSVVWSSRRIRTSTTPTSAKYSASICLHALTAVYVLTPGLSPFLTLGLRLK